MRYVSPRSASKYICEKLRGPMPAHTRTQLGGWSRCADAIAYYPSGAQELAASTTILTGATAGIGVATATALASIGGRVVLAARSEEKAKRVIDTILAIHPAAQLTFIQLELSSLASVNAFAGAFRKQMSEGEWPPLRCIVCNAGVINFTPKASADGFEDTFAVSHLAHFALVRLLHAELIAAKPSRVVVVSSGSHYGPHATRNVGSRDALLAHVARTPPEGRSWGTLKAMRAYGSAKLCNVIFAKTLQERLCGVDSSGIAACSLHPGTMMSTDIARDNSLFDFCMKRLLAPFTKDMDQGSSTTLACCLRPHSELRGQFYTNCQPMKESGLANEAACEVQWQLSEELCREVGWPVPAL